MPHEISVGKAKELIKTYIFKTRKGGNGATKRPIILFGPPGIGKTAISRQIAGEVFGSGEFWPKGNFHYVSLVEHEATDLLGQSELAKYLPVVEMPEEGEGIALFDDINTTEDVPTIKAAYQFMYFPRRVGERFLGDGWYGMATGNRMTDRAHVVELPSRLNNKSLILNVVATYDDWKAWALTNGIHPDLLAWHNYTEGTKLYAFDPEKYSPEDPFPSPRSWEAVSDLLWIGMDSLDAISMAIGEGMAAEVVGFLRTKNEMPDIDAILSGRSDKVPERPDTLHLVCSTLVARVKQKPKLTWRLVEYATLLPAEFAALLVMDAMRAGIPVKSETREFKRFARKHGPLILTEEELKSLRGSSAK